MNKKNLFFSELGGKGLRAFCESHYKGGIYLPQRTLMQK